MQNAPPTPKGFRDIEPNLAKKRRQVINRIIEVLEKNGFEVILAGRVRGQYEKDQRRTDKFSLTFKEKGVDVKIAVDMVSLSCDKRVKEVILGTSDSDLQPAITEVTRRKVMCVYLGFEVNPNKGLTYTTNRTILIRNTEVLKFEKVQSSLNFESA